MGGMVAASGESAGDCDPQVILENTFIATHR
jgi:hypothetical protein